ncbi:MAG: asparagine synthase (glutamine-hydrolyzing) [Bacteroidetes bacterium]|nr:asparagine synthase (glutamine-hydrolyzing) [Bacteroidota bacterium]
MCGILGYISKKSIDKQNFQEANIAIQHRGPDAEGFFYNAENTVAFAHRRLSILDLSSAANQPFTSNCGRYIIIYNGELYNFQDIKNKLQLETKTTSDTEVIVEAFAKIGTKVFHQLNGMFAFAIYDQQQNKIFLCRDRLGIKPLFIYQDATNIVFASELKAIKKFSSLDFSINKQVIPAFLHLGFITQPNTIYQKIQKFPTAHFAEIDTKNIQNKIEFIPYWNLSESINQVQITDFDEAKRQLNALLIESVEKQLISDVPIGTFLSGGIDSSLVTAIASKIKKDKINTFSIGFDYNKFDESQYAKQVSDYLQTKHHPFLVKEKDILEQLHKIISVYDEPYADSSAFPSMLVSKLAKQYVSVALSGDGGDELFYGYGAYIWANRLQKFPFNILHQPIYAITQLTKNNRIKRAGNLFKKKKKNHLNSHVFSQEQYFFSEQELIKLLVDKNYDNDFINLNDNFKENQQLSATEQQAVWDLQFYLKDDLLVKMDRASMQYSLEVRVPILDNSIVDFSFRIPSSFKIKDKTQKYILKEVLYDYVPKQIFVLFKQGFAIPLIRWLKKDWNFLIEKYLNKAVVEQYNLVHYTKVADLKNRFLKNEDYLYNRIWVLILIHWWLEENK